MNEIYFDNSATTKMCPAARERFLAVNEECWGNASSLHAAGLRAAHALEEGRRSVMGALGARDGQLVFTAGGSEANNLAILGRAYAKDRYRRGARIITTAGEHASVARPLERLKDEGYEIIEIPTPGGVLDMAALEHALTKNTVLVTMLLVNNETGALYDLKAAARLTHALAPEAVFHADATQAFMKLPLSPRDGYDMITISSHKIEGPKGVGALWVSPAIIKNKGLSPRMLGGGQEGGLRSGTENVAGCAAFGAACDYAKEHFAAHTAQLLCLQKTLLERLAANEALREVKVNLPPVRAPHIVSLTMPHIKSETMLHFLSGLDMYVSSGSACSSHGRHGSPPLLSFGLTEKEVDCTIRVSFSHHNTEEEIDRFLDALARGVKNLTRIR
ncbi:MAG: cysteine desulfurase [Clostridia bacterium]|nr:cysteine desulfurase [Clostridia bacterium]